MPGPDDIQPWLNHYMKQKGISLKPVDDSESQHLRRAAEAARSAQQELDVLLNILKESSESDDEPTMHIQV